MHPASLTHAVRPSCVQRGQNGDRDGFALLAALLATLLIAALVTGAFSATTEETRIAAAAADRQAALTSAESAIEQGISTLSSPSETPMSIGETRQWGIAGPGEIVVHITRLDSSRYWIVAAAGSNSSSSGISRRIGVVVRTRDMAGHSISIDRISERGWSELF